MRNSGERKEAGTVTRHLHVIATREPTKCHADPYKACPVGDVRREASVEKCYWIEVGKSGNTAYFRGKKATTEGH